MNELSTSENGGFRFWCSVVSVDERWNGFDHDLVVSRRERSCHNRRRQCFHRRRSYNGLGNRFFFRRGSSRRNEISSFSLDLFHHLLIDLVVQFAVSVKLHDLTFSGGEIFQLVIENGRVRYR
jgi:hypothetical protein